MKKTLTINISGLVFHIDEDAYEALQGYLSRINAHFGNTDEGKEIVADIESRIAELLQERIGDRKEVINLQDVEEVISIMGEAEEIMEESNEGEEPDEEEKEQESTTFRKTGKRVYRNPDDKYLGGVAGGIAAYFAIDPIIIRIIFILLFFISAGSITLVYIILWVVLPEAKTTAQKLEMKGERVNVENIEKTIKEEFHGVKENFDKMKKSRGWKNVGDAIEQIFRFLGSILGSFGKVLAGFLGAVLIIAGIAMLISLVSVFFLDHNFNFNPNWNFSDFPLPGFLNIFADPSISALSLIALAIVIGIPLLGLVYGGFKLLFGIQVNDKLIGGTAGGIWLIGFFIMLFVGIGVGKNFQVEVKEDRRETLEAINRPIYLKAENDTLSGSDYYIDLDEIRLSSSHDEGSIFLRPELDITKSTGNDIVLEIEQQARGANLKDARRNARHILFNWTQEDTLIIISPFFGLAKGQKWRNHELEVSLKIPAGTIIYLDDNLSEILYDVYNVPGSFDEDMTGQYWIMTAEGLDIYDPGQEEPISGLTPVQIPANGKYLHSYSCQFYF